MRIRFTYGRLAGFSELEITADKTLEAISFASGLRGGFFCFFLGAFFRIVRVCHKGCPLARVGRGQTVPVPEFVLS